MLRTVAIDANLQDEAKVLRRAQVDGVDCRELQVDMQGPLLGTDKLPPTMHIFG